ncbi:M48 family metallopeptidase [Cupriavidus basilensis]|uniref:M48 family metallopeptidase n=1 Tax=Cupriavidus basilensis TaxID=68895 RepID=UPI000750AF81|nr:M48 family metallopeptidase [Cupriavidus basilensis]
MPHPSQAPAPVAATYYDGRSSRAHAASLSVEGREAVLRDGGGAVLRRAPLSALRVSERVRRAPRLVTFADGAFCEIADHAGLAALLAASGHREGWVARAQNSWRLVLLSVLGLAAVLAVGYVVVLPWGAGVVARRVPPALEARLGEATLASIDDGLLAPSRLPAAQQERVRADFAALRRPPDPGHDYRIVFRRGGQLGANALALPGGTIVVTDELVKLAGAGPGLSGVLAHEAGHVAQRHGLQQVLQASAVGALAAYFFGDYSSVLAGVPATLLTLRYSREHERAADAYAVEVMRDNRLPVSAFADVLEALEAAHRQEEAAAPAASGDASAGAGGRETKRERRSRRAAEDGDKAGDNDFFSTHPLTRERIEALRAAARNQGG